MTEPRTFDSVVSVSPRFSRSVSLGRDVHRADALDGYILTPTGREILRRLAEALRGESHTRAWSLTGPFGSGKSALALLVAQLLGGGESVRIRARKFLTSVDSELTEKLFGAGGPLSKKAGRLCPVLVTGSRSSLEKAIAKALATSLREVAQRGRPPLIVEKLERLVEEPSSGASGLVALFEEANDYLERFGSDAGGFLLIVDELGKFLEYGANHPEAGDVFILQELAEAATRFERPFLFVTILHQALDRYADHMTPGRRAEWAKVQGRFEDVPFEERGEQLLRLLSHAIRREGDDTHLKALRKQADAESHDALAIGVRTGSMLPDELRKCLSTCYPLHPLTSLALGPLFRQFAQNERSLFAFLGSSEPFGFQEFLRTHSLKDRAYRLDHLYDYVLASLGPTLFAQHRSKLWSEVQSALDRLHDADELEIRLAKTIGLLQALGNSSPVPASAVTLRFALKGIATEGEIDAAIQSLTRRSVVVFRRHAGSYALWEGSDVDLDERLQIARQSVEIDQDLATFLNRQLPPRSRIARRHYLQTGTLRYFCATYCGQGDFKASLFGGIDDSGDADGRVLYCLPQDATDREALREQIRATRAADRPVIAALPKQILDLRELCHEVVCVPVPQLLRCDEQGLKENRIWRTTSRPFGKTEHPA